MKKKKGEQRDPSREQSNSGGRNLPPPPRDFLAMRGLPDAPSDAMNDLRPFGFDDPGPNWYYEPGEGWVYDPLDGEMEPEP